MKKLIFLLIASLIVRVSEGQERLYQDIAEELGDNAPIVQQLWPFEKEMMELRDEDPRFKVQYRLPFADGKASNISYNFETIRFMESAIYEHTFVDFKSLMEMIRAKIPEGFQLEFEQEIPNANGLLFANDEDGEFSEVYLLAGSIEKSELLYFILDKEESRHLQADLNPKFIHRKLDIFEKLRSQFPNTNFEVREIWSPKEAYAMSDTNNNPKGIVVSDVGFRHKVPLPIAGMKDLEIQLETKQLIEGIFLLAYKEQVNLQEFGDAVRQFIPEDFENQINHRSGEKAFELYTLPQAESDMVLYFSQNTNMVFVYYAEVEKGADYIENLILEINKNLK